MIFKSYIGIDYSGAATPEKRSATIQVYAASGGASPTAIRSPASSGGKRRNWNRSEVADWLAERLASSSPCIIGIDHGFSFPIDYFKRYGLQTWPEFLDDFVAHWPTDQEGATVEQFRADSARIGNAKELRLTERWTSSAKSVFQFDVQGSVAKSTHAGLPFLRQLRRDFRDVHFWPFDGWDLPTNKSVVAETFPSLFRNRYARDTRTVDQQDAFSIACWLRDMDRLGKLDQFASPPLNDQQRIMAALEGWIFGVL